MNRNLPDCSDRLRRQRAPLARRRRSFGSHDRGAKTTAGGALAAGLLITIVGSWPSLHIAQPSHCLTLMLRRAVCVGFRGREGSVAVSVFASCAPAPAYRDDAVSTVWIARPNTCECKKAV